VDVAIDWSRDPDTGITTFIVTGSVDGDAFIRTAGEVYAEERGTSHTLHLWDLRALSEPPSTPDVDRIAGFVRDNRPLVAGKIALVAASDLVYGLARMYEALLDGVPVDTHAFRTIAEAEHWLQSGSAKSPDTR
jgi:hypothetical protein